jgi:uncharacterized membrane protein
LPKRQRTSLLLLSLSLAIKQIAIFLVPLYLLWVWQRSDQDRIERVLSATAMIFSIPFVTSLPFLLWNAESFIKSIAFSMTRNPDTHFGARSVGEWMGLTGIPDRLPMLGLLLMVYAGMFQRRLGMYASALFVIVVFLDFNPVLFRQYMCWLVPFLPFVLCDESVIGVKHANT